MWVDMVNLIKLAWLKHALNISNPVKKVYIIGVCIIQMCRLILRTVRFDTSKIQTYNNTFNMTSLL